MFLAFGNINNRSTVSFVTAGDAWKLDKWLNNLPPNRVEIGQVPTALTDGNLPMISMDATWTRASLVLIRPEIVPNKPIMPPTQQIRLVDKPEFTLHQFEPNGTPVLNYKQMTTPGPYLNTSVTFMRLATIPELLHVSPYKRLVSLPMTGVKAPEPQLPDPVPVIRPPGPSTSRPSSALALTGNTPSPATSGNRSSSSSSTFSASASPRVRQSRLSLSKTPDKPNFTTKVLTFSPQIKGGHTIRVAPYGSAPASKKPKTASVHLDIAVSGDVEVEDQEPNNPNETIDITDSSQEDPEARDDSKHENPDEEDDIEEKDDHAKDKDYEPSKGRKRPHNK